MPPSSLIFIPNNPGSPIAFMNAGDVQVSDLSQDELEQCVQQISQLDEKDSQTIITSIGEQLHGDRSEGFLRLVKVTHHLDASFAFDYVSSQEIQKNSGRYQLQNDNSEHLLYSLYLLWRKISESRPIPKVLQEYLQKHRQDHPHNILIATPSAIPSVCEIQGMFANSNVSRENIHCYLRQIALMNKMEARWNLHKFELYLSQHGYMIRDGHLRLSKKPGSSNALTFQCSSPEKSSSNSHPALANGSTNDYVLAMQVLEAIQEKACMPSSPNTISAYLAIRKDEPEFQKILETSTKAEEICNTFSEFLPQISTIHSAIEQVNARAEALIVKLREIEKYTHRITKNETLELLKESNQIIREIKAHHLAARKIHLLFENIQKDHEAMDSAINETLRTQIKEAIESSQALSERAQALFTEKVAQDLTKHAQAVSDQLSLQSLYNEFLDKLPSLRSCIEEIEEKAKELENKLDALLSPTTVCTSMDLDKQKSSTASIIGDIKATYDELQKACTCFTKIQEQNKLYSSLSESFRLELSSAIDSSRALLERSQALKDQTTTLSTNVSLLSKKHLQDRETTEKDFQAQFLEESNTIVDGLKSLNSQITECKNDIASMRSLETQSPSSPRGMALVNHLPSAHLGRIYHSVKEANRVLEQVQQKLLKAQEIKRNIQENVTRTMRTLEFFKNQLQHYSILSQSHLRRSNDKNKRYHTGISQDLNQKSREITAQIETLMGQANNLILAANLKVVHLQAEHEWIGERIQVLLQPRVNTSTLQSEALQREPETTRMRNRELASQLDDARVINENMYDVLLPTTQPAITQPPSLIQRFFDTMKAFFRFFKSFFSASSEEDLPSTEEDRPTPSSIESHRVAPPDYNSLVFPQPHE